VQVLRRSGEGMRSVRWRKAGLKAAVLEFSSAELARSGGLLFNHPLFLGVGVADLDDMLLTSRTVNCSIVELLDDLLRKFHDSRT